MAETVTSQRKLRFENTGVEIAIAPNGGACFGVVRAIKLGEQVLKAPKGPVYSMGPLIHNPMTVEQFKRQGMEVANSVEEVAGGTVLLRSHGIRKEIEKELKAKGTRVVDATCPLVKKPQRIAQSVAQKGLYLVIVGDLKHPEVQGVLSYYGKSDFLVTYSPDDVEKIPREVSGVAVLAQTTVEAKVFYSVLERCQKHFKQVVEYNTICEATSVRQSEASELAQHAEVMIVVGGRNSSNTNKLVKICEQYCPETYMIEELKELQLAWFSGKHKIGVTGGASTPVDYVEAVGERVARMIQDANTQIH